MIVNTSWAFTMCLALFWVSQLPFCNWQCQKVRYTFLNFRADLCSNISLVYRNDNDLITYMDFYLSNFTPYRKIQKLTNNVSIPYFKHFKSSFYIKFMIWVGRLNFLERKDLKALLFLYLIPTPILVRALFPPGTSLLYMWKIQMNLQPLQLLGNCSEEPQKIAVIPI